MDNYLDNENFVNLMKSINIDPEITDEEDIELLYTIYKTEVKDFIVRIVNSYNEIIRNKDEMTDVLTTNMSTMSETEIKSFLEKFTKVFSSNIQKFDKVDLHNKLNDFFKLNEMTMVDLEVVEYISGSVYSAKSYVKETWVTENGTSIVNAYELSDEAFKLLDDKTKQKIINKQLELNLDVKNFEIDLLKIEDKIKFFEFKLNETIKKEEYEQAIFFKSKIDELKENTIK